MQRLGFIVSSVLLLVVGYVHWFKPAELTTEKTLRYRIAVQNTQAHKLQSVAVSVYAPLQKTAWQEVTELKASMPFNLQADEYLQQKMNFIIPELPPYGSKIITVTARLQLNEQPRSVGIRKKLFLAQQTYIEKNDARIQHIAAQLVRERDLAHAVYAWSKDFLSPLSYVEEDRGALYAFITQQGDCTEYSYLTTAVLRAAEIPARVMAGFVLEEDKLLQPEKYHNWTEFYQDHSWHILDAIEQVFDQSYENYVAFKIVGLTAGLKQSSLLEASGSVIATLY